MLGKLQALALIVGADALPVYLGGRIGQPLKHKPADDLAMFQNERHLARAHFEDGPRTGRLARLKTKARVEEAGIVHPKLAHQRVEGHHFGRVVEWNGNPLPGHENVELVRVEHEIAGGLRLNRVPE